ncbi:MAG: type VI secretion system tip protein TssI/VgrG [Polaromonas sp.]|nr:type VI secretion system tip protein TssI/VgrG [Polaromonas sp.]
MSAQFIPKAFASAARVLTLQGEVLDQEGIPPLEVIRLEGDEAINSLFEYQLQVQTAERAAGLAPWRLEPAQLLGREITVVIEPEAIDLGDAAVRGASGFAPLPARQITGLVTEVELLDADHRHQRCQLTLRPWLHLTTLASNHRIFQDMRAPEVIDAVLADYPYPVVRRLAAHYPLRDICMQRHESDFAFISRLLQEWGINYHFEHAQGAQRLVLSDHNSAFVAFPALGLEASRRDDSRHGIAIHPPGHRLGQEYIHAFSPQLRLTSTAWEARDYAYTQPRALMRARAGEVAPPAGDSLEQAPQSRQHASPADQPRQLLEQYHWRGASAVALGSAGSSSAGSPGGADWSQPDAGRERTAQASAQHSAVKNGQPGDRPDSQPEDNRLDESQPDFLARLRLEAIVQHRHRSRGAGHIRSIVPGCRFELSGHTQTSANTAHLVLAAHLLIEAPGQESQSATTGGRWQVHTRLDSQPAAIALRPDCTQARPVIAGVETALVTGPPGSDIHTDRLGRIKVKFPWDRLGREDHSSSCWVRVASTWAGNQLGAMHLPRIGQEVLVQFEGGDPDLPLVTGRVYNALNLPPWRLPGQQALSGFRSRELGGAEGAEYPASAGAGSAAGNLVGNAGGKGNAAPGRSNHLLLDDSAGQIQAQLKSDHQHSALSLGHISRIESNSGRQDARGQGLELRTDGHGALRAAMGLVLTSYERQAAAGSIKDVQEAVRALKDALERHDSHASAAGQHNVQDSSDQPEVANAIRTQNKDIAGSGKALGELQRPHILIASTAGIQSTANEDTHQASGGHHAITTGGHTSVSAGSSFLVSATQAVRLFARKAGMRLFAAQGDIEVQAQGGSIELRAKDTIRLKAGTIDFSASEWVLVNGAGSYVRLNGTGIEQGTKGSWTAHAANHGQTGPKNLPIDPLNFPVSRPDSPAHGAFSV